MGGDGDQRRKRGTKKITACGGAQKRSGCGDSQAGPMDVSKESKVMAEGKQRAMRSMEEGLCVLGGRTEGE